MWSSILNATGLTTADGDSQITDSEDSHDSTSSVDSDSSHSTIDVLNETQIEKEIHSPSEEKGKTIPQSPVIVRNKPRNMPNAKSRDPSPGKVLRVPPLTETKWKELESKNDTTAINEHTLRVQRYMDQVLIGLVNDRSFTKNRLVSIEGKCDRVQEMFSELVSFKSTLKDEVKTEIKAEIKDQLQEEMVEELEKTAQNLRQDMIEDQGEFSAQIEERISSLEEHAAKSEAINQKNRRRMLNAQWEVCKRGIVLEGLEQNKSNGKLVREAQWETKRLVEADVLTALNMKDEVEIDTAFRLPRRNNPKNKPDKVVIRLVSQHHKTLIMSNLKNLKGNEKAKYWHFEDEVPELLREAQRIGGMIAYQFRLRNKECDTRVVFKDFKYRVKYRNKGERDGWKFMTDNEMESLLPDSFEKADNESLWFTGEHTKAYNFGPLPRNADNEGDEDMDAESDSSQGTSQGRNNKRASNAGISAAQKRKQSDTTNRRDSTSKKNRGQ